MLSNFGYNICTVWWIKSYYISFLVLLVLVFCLMFCCYRIWRLYPAFVSASLHDATEFLNIFSFVNNCDNLNSIDFGSSLIMDGGWLDFVLTLFYWLLIILLLPFRQKHGMLSFLNSKWHLRNSRLFCCIEL